MDTSQDDAGVTLPAKRGWRRHSDEFKLRVIELARQGHGSVAAVALANGLNANMLRRWVREAELADAPGAAGHAQAIENPAVFVPVVVADSSSGTAAAIEPAQIPSPPALVNVEIRRGTSSVSASLPMDARSAAWLREVLG